MPRLAPEPRKRRATISGHLVRSLCDCLKNEGVRIDALLKRQGIPTALLEDPEGEVELHRYVMLFEDAARQARDPQLGLRLSQRMGAHWLGVLGVLFLASETALAALANMARYLDLLQTHSRNQMIKKDRVVEVHYAILDDSIAVRRQDSEYSIGSLLQLARLYAKRRITPVEARFEHAAPQSRQAYREILGCPVLFDQATNALVLRRADLDQPVPPIDTRLFPILERQLVTRLTQRSHPSSFSERVGAVLAMHLPVMGPIGERVARRLGTSPATLYRRLRAEGQSLRSVVAERQLGIVRRYLEDSQLSVMQIAHLVGYAETACLTRAFKRWTGMTPAAFRRAARERRKG